MSDHLYEGMDELEQAQARLAHVEALQAILARANEAESALTALNDTMGLPNLLAAYSHLNAFQLEVRGLIEEETHVINDLQNIILQQEG